MNVAAIYTGGLDSTVLLYELRHQGYQIVALDMSIEQNHRELQAAQTICDHLHIPRRICILSPVQNLLGVEYPNKEMILLSIASSYAINNQCQTVAYSTLHADKMDAILLMEKVVQWMNPDREINFYTPFASLSKSDLVRLGVERNVPFHITWSCLKGGDKHCGQCCNCIERKGAFRTANISDPTKYEQ